MEIENSGKSEDVTSRMECEQIDTIEIAPKAVPEDGEISSSEDESRAPKQTETHGNIFTNFNRNYDKNQRGGFVTGVNVFDKDEAAKKIDRAKRFSIPIDSGSNPQIQLEELQKLHKDLGIDKDSEKHFRFNAIHMRGTDDMSTEDVFQYFEHFAPSHVQWINDKSCNVVWMDDISAARAMIQLSKRIRNLDKIHLNANPFEKELHETKELEEEINADEEDEESVDARKIETAIPPGYWRLGVTAPKSSCILLRYAMRADKKQHNAEKNSAYYRKYGNPHYGNKPGIFTNSLRFKKYNIRKPGNKWKKRLDKVIDKKNPWKDLAYTWGKLERGELDMIEETDYGFNKRNQSSESNNGSKYEPTVPDLRLSLEQKKDIRKRKHDDETCSVMEETWRKKLKAPRMKMHADDEEEKSHNYLIIKPVADLRKKICSNRSERSKFFLEREMRDDSSVSDSLNSESEYEEDDEYDLEAKRWYAARLEERRRRNQDCQSASGKEDSDSDDYYDYRYDKECYKESNNDDSYKGNIGYASPLRIEIDNDEYYFRREYE